MVDHDRRMETLLANRDTVSARRILPMTSPQRRAVYDARIALQTGAVDVDRRVAAHGHIANTHPGLLRDRADRMRDTNQGYAARALLPQSPQLHPRPHQPDKRSQTPH